jgi:hypothetical protein
MDLVTEQQLAKLVREDESEEQCPMARSIAEPAKIDQFNAADRA